MLILREKRNDQETPKTSKQHQRRIVIDQKGDRSTVFSTKTILIAITILNFVLFVGGSIYSGITLQSIREQYQTAISEITTVKNTFETEKKNLQKSVSEWKTAESGREASLEKLKDKMDDMEKEITTFYAKYTGEFENASRGAINQIEFKKKTAIENIEQKEKSYLGELETTKNAVSIKIKQIEPNEIDQKKLRDKMLKNIEEKLTVTFETALIPTEPEAKKMLREEILKKTYLELTKTFKNELIPSEPEKFKIWRSEMLKKIEAHLPGIFETALIPTELEKFKIWRSEMLKKIEAHLPGVFKTALIPTEPEKLKEFTDKFIKDVKGELVSKIDVEKIQREIKEDLKKVQTSSGSETQ